MRGRLRAMTATALAMGLAWGAAASGRAGNEVLDDDLAVVRKAVRADPADASSPAPDRPPGTARFATRVRRGEGQWLKVRIVEGSGKRSRITVNLPLAMVRNLGDDLPLELGDEKVRLSDVLRTLEAGEALVEVKKRDANVRVWIE
jgi:hypothetical protein